jgi:hypothetical protein
MKRRLAVALLTALTALPAASGSAKTTFVTGRPF